MSRIVKLPAFRRSMWVLVALIYLLPLVAFRGAIGAAFMKFDGVDGESLDRDHKDWIDVLSFDVGVSRPVTGAGTARTNGPARFKDIVCTKWIDKSSPDLMLSSCAGKVFPKVEIDVTAVGIDSNQDTDVTYTLYEVLVTSASPSGSTGGGDPMPTEEVTLNFTKIEYEYRQTDPATGATNFQRSITCDVPDRAP